MYKDKVDEKIIGYLKEDSRESFVDIGKKLKLSESAVRRRVKNLVDSGTIKKFTLELEKKMQLVQLYWFQLIQQQTLLKFHSN